MLVLAKIHLRRYFGFETTIGFQFLKLTYFWLDHPGSTFVPPMQQTGPLNTESTNDNDECGLRQYY